MECHPCEWCCFLEKSHIVIYLGILLEEVNYLIITTTQSDEEAFTLVRNASSSSDAASGCSMTII